QPGGLWGGNVSQAAHLGLDPSSLPNRHPATLGGFEIGADIIYDVNNDGLYETLATNPSTLDQEDKSVLYVGSPPPSASNDECGGATGLPQNGPFPVTQTEDTNLASSNATDPLQSCTSGGAARNAHSVWFTWTAGASQRMSFSTCGSDYDTVL